ncbi:MAG: hypothetical protein EU529_16655 [Promethearchaeota archaeon]|nr:MAG: hypothetical protein EU529_16655 [Candidatus Lokiarchaeota archaeon]
MNPVDIRKKGIEALNNALGPVGMVRFLHQFESGSGDYTKERHIWLKDKDIDSILEEMKPDKNLKKK